MKSSKLNGVLDVVANLAVVFTIVAAIAIG